MRIPQINLRKLSVGFLSLMAAFRPVATRITCLFAAGLVILCGCQPSVRNAAALASPIRLAVFYWPGTYWIVIAAKKGWFREAGLNVELVDCNGDYFGSEKDLVEGRLDANTFFLFDLLDYIAHVVALVNVWQRTNSQFLEGSFIRALK